MKRLLLFVLLASVLAIGTVSADSGFHVKPFGALDVGLGNYVRGVSGGAQAYYSLGGLWLGLEAKVEYDSAYKIAAFPTTIDLGLGQNFWLMAGTTLGPNPNLGGVPLTYSGLFNTYGLGVQFINLNLKFAHLVAFSELTYTATKQQNPSDQLTGAFATLGATLLGLKGYLAAGLDFKI